MSIRTVERVSVLVPCDVGRRVGVRSAVDSDTVPGSDVDVVRTVLRHTELWCRCTPPTTTSPSHEQTARQGRIEEQPYKNNANCDYFIVRCKAISYIAFSLI